MLRTWFNKHITTPATVSLFFMLSTLMCRAQSAADIDSIARMLPDEKLTRIEVMFENGSNTTVNKWYNVQYRYTDILTGKDKILVGQRVGSSAFMLQMHLRHPLYDVAKEGGRSIPFYVNPGDYLIITVKQNGSIQYRMGDRSNSPYEALLTHDNLSRKAWYSNSLFEADRKCGSYAKYIARIVHRMDSVVGAVSSLAAQHNFTQEETSIAINNVKMQFAVWMMEYASWKSVQIGLHSEKDNAGWQSEPQHEADMGELEDVHSYTFLRRLPLNDPTCMASPHYPAFMQSYSHTHILTHDQYLYLGKTKADHARMDSAFVAREKAMTRLPYPSVFLETALQQRYLERHPRPAMPATTAQQIDTANSIILPDVEVLSQKLRERGMTLSEEERLNVALNNAPVNFNPLAPVLHVVDKHIIKPLQRKGSKKRRLETAKEIIRKYAEDDEEYEQLLKVCEKAEKDNEKKEDESE